MTRWQWQNWDEKDGQPRWIVFSDDGYAFYYSSQAEAIGAARLFNKCLSTPPEKKFVEFWK